MKIDVYNHVLPPAYFALMRQHSKDAGMVKRMSGLPLLWDLDARVRMLEAGFEAVQQVLTLALPSPDMLGDAAASPGFAGIANDGMAAIVGRWPSRFPAFVASLPMNNVDAALEEMDRAIGQLGAAGIQILTSVGGRPLDDPEFFPIFDRITRVHRRPIWMHPVRPATRADYPSETSSQYEIWQVLGWPMETSVAMARIVFSGLFDRLPAMRLITHHCGAMVPYFAGRAESLWAQLGSRSERDDAAGVLARLAKSPIEYFRMFYADTVLGGSTSALRCGLDFFGADKIVFASDCPFDPEGGPAFIRDGLASIDALGLADDDRHKICCGNALRLLKVADV